VVIIVIPVCYCLYRHCHHKSYEVNQPNGPITPNGPLTPPNGPSTPPNLMVHQHLMVNHLTVNHCLIRHFHLMSPCTYSNPNNLNLLVLPVCLEF
jgi:hypothetical protein